MNTEEATPKLLEGLDGRIAVVGATGAVGREMLQILEQSGITAERLALFGSSKSVGRTLEHGNVQVAIGELDEHCFDGIGSVFFTAGAEVATAWAPRAVAAGSVVIDNSSAFRGDPSVPLVIPEVNPDALDGFQRPGIIANPNCSTIILLMAINAVHRAVGIKRMSVATYQSVSGAGAAAMAELESQAAEHASGNRPTVDALPSQALFNLFSHESRVGEDGFNEEERKIRTEGRKILGSPDIAISATCIRVGIPRAHSMAIDLELESPLEAKEARRVLENAAGVEVVDDRHAGRFPEPLHATGRDDVLVGRIRNDPDRTDGCGLLLFACGDQLRKGAALNAVQILDLVSRL